MKNDLIKKQSVKHTKQQLIRLQSLPLAQKIPMILRRAENVIVVEHNYKVIQSHSGGKDSDVCLDLMKKIDPNIKCVHNNTGREYVSILEHVKKIPNMTIIQPSLTNREVIEKYGYPVLSKKISMGLDRYRNTKSEVQKELRLNGGINPTSGKKQNRTIPKYAQFLIDAPFNCSEKCCVYTKEIPLKKYAKQHDLYTITGETAEESADRTANYLKHGCNISNKTNPRFTPIAILTEKDIWRYIEINDIEIADIYNHGVKRTGCVDCTFGYWGNDKDTEGDRFKILKKLEPKRYERVMRDFEKGGLGLKAVIDFVDRGLIDN